MMEYRSSEMQCRFFIKREIDVEKIVLWKIAKPGNAHLLKPEKNVES